MKSMIAALLLLVSAPAWADEPMQLASLNQPDRPHSVPLNMQVAVVCFSKGEQTSGMNKICYYDCLGSMAAITVSAVSLCPLTIEQ